MRGWIGNWFYGRDIKGRRPCEPISLGTSPEEMRAAKEAVERMRLRQDEDIDVWATTLGAQYGKLTD